MGLERDKKPITKRTQKQSCIDEASPSEESWVNICGLYVVVVVVCVCVGGRGGGVTGTNDTVFV